MPFFRILVANPFCQEWARKLLDAQSDIQQMNKGKGIFSASLLLRRILEHCKTKVVFFFFFFFFLFSFWNPLLNLLFFLFLVARPCTRSIPSSG